MHKYPYAATGLTVEMITGSTGEVNQRIKAEVESGNVTVEGYADLLNPALKGKIISADPANSSSAFQCLIGMLYGMGNGDPMSQEAWDFIDQFLVNLDGKVASSSSQVYNGVANGEYYVGLSYEDPCVELEAAQKFVDYVLSEEVQSAVAAELNLRPLRAGIAVNSKMIPNEEIKLFDTYSAAYIAEHKAEIVNTYLEHVEMMME